MRLTVMNAVLTSTFHIRLSFSTESHFNQLLKRSCLMSHQNSYREIYFCSDADNVKQIPKVLVTSSVCSLFKHCTQAYYDISILFDSFML